MTKGLSLWDLPAFERSSLDDFRCSFLNPAEGMGYFTALISPGASTCPDRVYKSNVDRAICVRRRIKGTCRWRNGGITKFKKLENARRNGRIERFTTTIRIQCAMVLSGAWQPIERIWYLFRSFGRFLARSLSRQHCRNQAILGVLCPRLKLSPPVSLAS